MRRLIAVGILGLSFAVLYSSPALAGGPGVLDVRFQWLVGHPASASPDRASVVLLPGTIVMAGESAQREVDRTLLVIAQLKETYRLGRLEPENVAQVLALARGKETPVPTGVGSVKAHCALVAFDDRQATLRLKLSDGAKTLAEPTISVLRGGQAIVGARDGEAAPYLFLLIHPPAAGSGASPSGREPKIVHKVAPKYPPDARKAGIQGLVLLRCVIGPDGAVTSVAPANDAPAELVEAATAAVRQWRYEPTQDAQGKAIEVTMTVSVNFAIK
jgi:TonB family protein